MLRQFMQLGLRPLAVVLATLLAVGLLHQVRPAPGAPLADIQWHFESPLQAPEQPVQLPHSWPRSGDDGDAAARYHGRFVLSFVPEADRPWSLYLTSLGGHARVHLNGVRLDAGKSPSPPGARTYAQPLSLPLPAPLLRPGSNEITIELQAEDTGGFLGRVYAGPAERIAAYAWFRYFLKHTLLLMLIVTSFVLGGVSLVVWLARRQEPVYLWHALTCFSGGGYSVIAQTAFAHDIPLSPLWSDALSSTLFIWFVIAGACLGIYYHDLRRLWLLRLLACAGVLALVLPALAAVAVGAGALPFRAMAACYALGILLGLFTGWRAYIEPYWLRPSAATFWLLAGALCMATAAIRDALVLFRLISPEHGLWFAYAAPVALLAFTWLLLRRFLDAVREAEQLNRHLEQRVADREAEIARNYDELRHAGQVQAIAAERERLLGELHDGLGGTLVAALSRLSNQGNADSPVAHSLQSALDDLRLTLGSLHPDETSLRATLAPLRERLSGACADAGIELSFDLDGISDRFALPKPQLLHVLRILQEAASNALRHARARQLRIAVRLIGADGVQPTQLELCVDDDGIGCDPAAAQRSGHYGLPNLQRRATQLGAQIEWQERQPGTRVRLRLPLNAGGNASA